MSTRLVRSATALALYSLALAILGVATGIAWVGLQVERLADQAQANEGEA